MSNQTKIKQLTLDLIEQKKISEMWEHINKILLKRNDELEQENKQPCSQYVDIQVHIEELEQDLKDNELRRADLLRTLIKSTSKVQELEQEKAELVELVEEAEKMYCDYRNIASVVAVLSRYLDALQALKKDHPEFGGKK